MRAIKSFSLGFGMVAIPVKLYGATDDKGVGLLNNLHSECKSRLKQPKYCPTCEKMLEGTDEIIKGYEISKGNYIPVTPAELDSIRVESNANIVVQGFAKSELLGDPRWVKDSYLLSPDEPGAKAFVLFVKAMEAAGVIGISKISIREKEQLCAIVPFNGLLLLQTIHWADELRDYSELMVFASITDQEMGMANQLIGAMTKDIDLASFKDEYREALVEMLEAKTLGQSYEPIKPKKQEADLTSALEASLKAMGNCGVSPEPKQS